MFNFGSGIMGDLWDHKRLMVFGAVLFAAGRPMFAATGWVHAAAGAAGDVPCSLQMDVCTKKTCGVCTDA